MAEAIAAGKRVGREDRGGGNLIVTVENGGRRFRRNGFGYDELS
ncbi:hypothetical protein AB5I41_21635 [Sphingomonas sp. MMS24-JH45]